MYFFKKEFLFIASILALYIFFLLKETVIRQGNLADLFLSVIEFHALSYFITPIFLIAITSFLSLGQIQTYLIFRFKCKKEWYNTNVILIAKFVTLFCLYLLVLISLEALFVLNFENQWSKFAVQFYTSHIEFLSAFNPIVIIITSFLLLWCYFFLLSLIYYVIYLIGGKIIVAFFALFALNSINIGVKLSQLESISYYFFYNRVNVFQYLYMTHSKQDSLPVEMFLYWILLIIVIYLLGYFIINKLDIDTMKGIKK